MRLKTETKEVGHKSRRGEKSRNVPDQGPSSFDDDGGGEENRRGSVLLFRFNFFFLSNYFFPLSFAPPLPTRRDDGTWEPRVRLKPTAPNH